MLKYICDQARHLVCLPYSIENLHQMVRDLNIKKCWFHHPKGRYAHYDIPKLRILEITAKCQIVSTLEVLTIVKTSK